MRESYVKKLFLAEVRHGSVEFCDFEVEVGGSLLFTIEELRKAM